MSSVFFKVLVLSFLSFLFAGCEEGMLERIRSKRVSSLFPTAYSLSIHIVNYLYECEYVERVHVALFASLTQAAQRVPRRRALRRGDAQVGARDVQEAHLRPLVADWCALRIRARSKCKIYYTRTMCVRMSCVALVLAVYCVRC